VVAAQTLGRRLQQALLMGKSKNGVRRAASQHGGRGKPAATHSPKTRRRRCPARQSQWRLGPVALLWAGCHRSAPVDLQGKEGERGSWHGEKTAAWRALTCEGGDNEARASGGIDGFYSREQKRSLRRVAAGGQWPLIGGPRAEETATDTSVCSYFISNPNKRHKMNSPWEK
jgi:hypothetical protein